MSFNLPLSTRLKQGRWKVKIFDKENREPPHVTIIRGIQKWRIDLRTKTFLDRLPPSRDIDREVIKAIQDNWDLLKEQWDQIHPNNPVEGPQDDES